MEFYSELVDKMRSPREADLIEGLSSIDGDKCNFAGLADDDGSLVQAYGDPISGFVVEYRSVPLKKHFCAENSAFQLEEVEKIFVAFFNGDVSWYDDYEWKELTDRGNNFGLKKKTATRPKRIFRKGIRSTISIERTSYEKNSERFLWIIGFIAIALIVFFALNGGRGKYGIMFDELEKLKPGYNRSNH